MTAERQGIAILGAGHVGRALGQAWTREGHRVRFGVSRPDRPAYADLPGPVTSVREAAQGGSVLVLATPWAATEDALREAGQLAGKIVIDCTNPLTKSSEGYGLHLGWNRSGGELVAGWANGAAVCKTFNQTSWENMADARSYPLAPAMFVAGDDSGAKAVVMGLVNDLGFEAIDAGPLRMARVLEPLAVLWLELATHRGLGRDIALALLRRSADPEP